MVESLGLEQQEGALLGKRRELGRQACKQHAGKVKRKRSLTRHPGHDSLQQAQRHRAQDAPHHVPLLRHAQRAHEHGQHVCRGRAGMSEGDRRE